MVLDTDRWAHINLSPSLVKCFTMHDHMFTISCQDLVMLWNTECFKANVH